MHHWDSRKVKILRSNWHAWGRQRARQASVPEASRSLRGAPVGGLPGSQPHWASVSSPCPRHWGIPCWCWQQHRAYTVDRTQTHVAWRRESTRKGFPGFFVCFVLFCFSDNLKRITLQKERKKPAPQRNRKETHLAVVLHGSRSCYMNLRPVSN